MLANLKIICQFHAHSVHQNIVEIFWAEIYRGWLLTLLTGSSSGLLRIRFSADLTMYWFPVYHFRCMQFKPLVIWIWNQNIAISTIVWTSSHIKGPITIYYHQLMTSLLIFKCPLSHVAMKYTLKAHVCYFVLMVGLLHYLYSLHADFFLNIYRSQTDYIYEG